MDKLGDTPQGMVQSAMEYLRICNEQNFKNVVVSIKSSNTQVMVRAYRLLASEMMNENLNFPLHLGVTEAGDSEDGRIKSAVGIGSLLADGIGDTIRVSLTEDPECEIPVAKILAKKFENRKQSKIILESEAFNAFEFSRRKTFAIDKIGGTQTVVVISSQEIENAETKPDYFLTESSSLRVEQSNFTQEVTERLLHCVRNDVKIETLEINVEEPNIIEKIQNLTQPTLLIASTKNSNYTASLRRFFIQINENKIENPIILKYSNNSKTKDEFIINSAADLGSILIDGFGDGILLENCNFASNFVNQTAFGILQACRLRFSKTEYIMCPSCGRTLFDIQKVSAIIKQKTNHLKGLKIAVMGCIVNGPGEMADADYGYVGAGSGRVTLYKNKEVMKRSVLEENAVDELIELIKEFGDWKNIKY
jgi:(E)-4-hydroxy-3-methylbut-2-enyl-diphosphate synthase